MKGLEFIQKGVLNVKSQHNIEQMLCFLSSYRKVSHRSHPDSRLCRHTASREADRWSRW